MHLKTQEERPCERAEALLQTPAGEEGVSFVQQGENTQNQEEKSGRKVVPKAVGISQVRYVFAHPACHFCRLQMAKIHRIVLEKAHFHSVYESTSEKV